MANFWRIRWQWFFCEQVLLDLACFGCPWSRLLFCFGVIRIDRIRHRECIILTSLCTHWHKPFFKQILNYARSNVKESSNFWMSAGGSMMLQSHGMPRSCFISSRVALMFFGSTIDFGRPSRNSSWSEDRPRLNSLYQFFTGCRLVLHPHIKSYVHQCTLALIIHIESDEKL